MQRIRQIERLADLKIEQRLELIDRNIGLRRLVGAVGTDVQPNFGAGRRLAAAERRLRRDMAERNIAACDALRRRAKAALRQQPLRLRLILIQNIRHKLLLRAETDDEIDAGSLQNLFAARRRLLDDAAARDRRMVAQRAFDAVKRQRAQILLGCVKTAGRHNRGSSHRNLRTEPPQQCQLIRLSHCRPRAAQAEGVTGSSGSSTTRSVIFESEVSGEPGVTL